MHKLRAIMLLVCTTVVLSLLAPTARAQQATMCYSLCWNLAREARCFFKFNTTQEQQEWSKIYQASPIGKAAYLASLNNSTDKMSCPSNDTVSFFGGTRSQDWAPVHGGVLVTIDDVGLSPVAFITGHFVPVDATFFPDAGAIK